MFNQILVELGLKFDREGRPRTRVDASAISVRKKKPPKKEVAEIRRGELETLR